MQALPINEILCASNIYIGNFDVIAYDFVDDAFFHYSILLLFNTTSNFYIDIFQNPKKLAILFPVFLAECASDLASSAT